MLTVIIIKSDADHLFQQKEMSLQDFIVGTVSLENGESFEVELLNPQHAPFYKVNYNPTLNGAFDLYLLQRFKELRKQKHLDKASYEVFCKWVKAACSEELLSSRKTLTPPKKVRKKKEYLITEEDEATEGMEPKATKIPKKVKSKKTKIKKSINYSHLAKRFVGKLTNFLPSARVAIWIGSVLLLLGLAVGGGVTIAYFTQDKQETVAPKKTSFSKLLQNKSYQKMYEEYPDKFWDWEADCVKELDTDQLVAAYEEVPELSIAYDLAFVEEAYNKVVEFYEEDALEIEMNQMRTDFAAYSYLQLGDLETAEKVATSDTSEVFYEALGWAYLAKGDVEKANDVTQKANSKALTQQIKDYQLVETTLNEVEKQLDRKGLSSDLRNELEQSKKDLQEQLEELKKKPREESEDV